MKKIAVIIPVYNAYPFLPELIECIKNQTMDCYQVYLVDDCSTDGSYEYLLQYKEEEWILLQNEQRSGAAYSRNRGIGISSEEYIQCIDADDLIATNFFEEICTVINNTAPEVVMLERNYFDTTMREQNGKDNNRQIRYPEGAFRVTDFEYCFPASCKVATCDFCIKRELIDKYSIRFQNLKSSNDVFYMLSSILLADSIVHTKTYEPIYHNRIHNSADRISINRDPMNAYLALLEVKNLLEKQGKMPHIGRIFWQYALLSLQDQLNMCRDQQRKRDVYAHLQKEGFKALGVGDRLFIDSVPEIYQRQYQELMEKTFEDVNWKHSLYMSALCHEQNQKIESYMIRLKNKKTIGFWGMGYCSKGFIDVLNESGIELDYYFDTNLDIGNNYGVQVTDFNLVSNRVDAIIISSVRYFEEIAQRIHDANSDIEIICMEDILYN